MKNLNYFVAILFLVSCAHHRDVRPGVKGEHLIILKTEDKTSGYGNAKSQADHYCQMDKRRAYIITEGHKYTGSMKEENYNNAKMASKVAKGVGATGYVFGGKKEQKAGGILGLGGQIADDVIGQGYTYKMQFKCK